MPAHAKGSFSFCCHDFVDFVCKGDITFDHFCLATCVVTTPILTLLAVIPVVSTPMNVVLEFKELQFM